MPGLDSASRHRFRPLDPALERQGQYQPSYTYPGGSGLSSSLPSPQPIEPRGQYSPSQPGMSYRFRPLDPDRQSRRWTGNYARPGNPGNYAAPQRLPRAPVGNDSLWANSMPEY
jgi:hypothetical protein